MPPPIRARIAPRVVDEIREVFVSSTAKDVQAYRTQVKVDLELNHAAVFLQESWAEPARDVLELCLQRLEDSDAYLGVFGYRYGWIPEGREESITELECEHAFYFWRASTVPPIFLFVPEPESDAARELEGFADEVLKLEYSEEPDKRARSKQLQTRFRDRLLSSGRFLKKFGSLPDLRVLASTSVSNWNNAILRSALNGRREALSAIPPQELGEIGRDQQVAALVNARSALELSSSPGMCILIHGRDSAGKFPFGMYLKFWDGWGLEQGTPGIVTPPHDRFDEAALRSSVFSAVAPGKTPAEATFDELAAAILAECAKTPVVLMLPRFESLESIEEFQRMFWMPLLGAMRAKEAKPPSERLTMILTSLSPLPTSPPAGVWPGAIDTPQVDYNCLMPLPELADLTAKDVNSWLMRLKVGDSARRSAIANEVTREDGVPANVFDRLNSNGFWATLES
jgi:hypothetical protein